MAANGYKDQRVSDHDTLRFYWATQSQSVENNTSTINWQMQLISDAYGAIDSSASKSYIVTVNGTQYTGSNYVSIGNSTTKTLASGTITIPHDTDGSKTFSFSFRQTFGINFSGTLIQAVGGSGSGTLTAISRVSTLVVSNGTLGTAQTITANRPSSSFRHTVKIECGTYTDWVAAYTDDSGTKTSWSWTPPLKYADGAANGTSAYATVTLFTYHNGTCTGSKSKGIWLAIPATIVPTVNFTVTDATNWYGTLGKYLQSQSKLQIAVTAAGAYGSTIKSYQVSVDGNCYTTKNVTTTAIQTSGTVPVKVTVKDSRGRTATSTQNLTVQSYHVPQIERLSVIRCKADGTEDAGGSYCKATFTYSIDPISNKNAKAAKLLYKKASETSYTTQTLTAAYSVTGQTVVFAADDASTYDVQLELTDSIGSTSKIMKLSTGFCLYHIPASGKGIAFGKIAEKNGLDIGMAVTLRKGLAAEWQLASGDDLNDCTTVGKYVVELDSTAGSVSNMPISKAGSLYVIAPLNPGQKAIDGAWRYVVQIYVDYGGEIYTRDINTNVDGDVICGTWGRNDRVAARGKSGIWTYKKYADGWCECWGSTSKTVSLSSNYQGVYYNAVSDDLPFEITGGVTFLASGRTSSNVVTVSPASFATEKITAWVIGHISGMNVTLKINYYVNGYWM